MTARLADCRAGLKPAPTGNHVIVGAGFKPAPIAAYSAIGTIDICGSVAGI